MAYTGGDIIEISYNHPVVGSGVLSPKASEDNEYDFGGVRTADDENMITPKGEAIYTMNTKRWKVTCTVASDMNLLKECEKMNLMTAAIEEATWTFQHINGTVYKGKGKVVGDIKLNVNQTTFSLMVSGGQILAQ